MNAPPSLVLASASPRRSSLLRQLGISFDVRVADLDEDMLIASMGDGVRSARQKVLLLAEAKAEMVASARPKRLVLAADTTVVLNSGCDFGKPRDDSAAAAMLRSLSGEVHRVITGVALCEGRRDRRATDAVMTEVRMRDLSSEIIERYVASGEPRDKAGAYAIQGLGALLVRGISGSYTNVVGLPLEILPDLFERLGYSVWDYVL